MNKVSLQDRFWRAVDRLASVVIIVAAVLIAAALLPFLRDQISTQPEPTVEAAAVAEASDGNVFTLVNATAQGRSDARIALVEFSDFQCPYCAAYSRDAYPKIQAEFVDTGKLRYVFRHFPLNQIHPSARKAAEAVECAGEQGRFWQMRDWLFAHQRELAASGLPGLAATLGLDAERFASCLAGQKAHVVKADEDEGARLGINSTPTFLVGELQPDGRITIRRRIKGAQPYDVFKSVIDDSITELAR